MVPAIEWGRTVRQGGYPNVPSLSVVTVSGNPTSLSPSLATATARPTPTRV